MLTFPPLDGAVGAAATVLSVLATAAAPLAGANAAAVAIIGATMLVRLLISPLSYLQARAERRRAALAPRVRELHRRHRHDRERLQAELVALYRAEGASPLGGCLPALLQAPFFLVMYRLATAPPAASGLLDETLFGVPLGHRLADGLAGAAGPVTAGLFALLAVLAWWLSRRARRAALRAADPAAEGNAPPGTAALTRLAPLLPYGTLLVAAVVPLGAGLYLLTTTAWTALEHAVLRRGGATGVTA
jgi:YidC/Oxa1 family membrane protein insertase